ncbi:hypothetical protein ACQ4PT_002195 [Festuca glaucescens]
MDAAAPPPSTSEEPPARDWSLLPLDVLASVFVRLSAVDVLRGAGLVCRSWLQAAKVPDVWRVVDMGYHNIMFKYDEKEHADLCAMAKAAVDRSDGQLREFAGRSFVTDELMQYIVERSPSLTTLRLVCCWKVHCWKVFSARLAGAITESPLNKLQSLELDDIDLLVGELIAILENCPNLDVLTVRDCSGMDEEDEPVLRAKFARIKNLIYDCVGECFDDCWRSIDGRWVAARAGGAANQGLVSVFVMLGTVDVLMGAGLVCRSWLQAAKLPDVWRVVDIGSRGRAL